MTSPHVTSWTIIESASAGEARARQEFALRYESLIRAYLGKRWRRTPLIDRLDDTVQDVFVECFRTGGVLEKVDPQRPGGFRAFLYGVIRNVAMRTESKQGRNKEHPAATQVVASVESDEATLSRVFDQAWLNLIIVESGELHRQRAAATGGPAQRRVQLLELRFGQELPIREIAKLWGEDAAAVHRQYRIARQEFKEAMLEVLAQHHGGSREQIEEEGDRLLALFE